MVFILTHVSYFSAQDHSLEVSVDPEPELKTKRARPISFANSSDGSSMDVDDQSQNPKYQFDRTIQACLSQGLKPWGIVKVLNTFIIDAKIEMDFFTRSTILRRIDELFLAKIRTHTETMTELRYIGYDERCDSTLTENNSMVRESHITFVDSSGDYIDHSAMTKCTRENEKDHCKSGKCGVDVFGAIYKVLVSTLSLLTLTFIASDGTNVNTGREGGANRLLELKLQRVSTMIHSQLWKCETDTDFT